MRFVNLGNCYTTSFDSNESIDGLEISDIITVTSHSPIVIAYVCRLLKQCKKISIVRNDDIIQFRILEMKGSIYSPMVFVVDESDNYNKLQQQLRSIQQEQ